MFDPRKDAIIIDIGDEPRIWLASDVFTYGFPHKESLAILQPKTDYYYFGEVKQKFSHRLNRLMNNPVTFDLPRIRSLVETKAQKLDPLNETDKSFIDKAVNNYKKFLEQNTMKTDKDETLVYEQEIINSRKPLNWKEYYKNNIIGKGTWSKYLDERRLPFNNEKKRMSIV